MSKEVIFTGSIPQCPHCEKPTKRTQGGSMSTLAYYQPIYDENGVNTNPDRNTITTEYSCLDCGKDYVIRGNYTDGFTY
jgi:hypothetical protein